MTFDLSQRLSDWGSTADIPLSSFETYGHVFGLDEIGNDLEWGRPPHLIVYPRFPHYTRLAVRLRSVNSRWSLGCFDQTAIEKAYMRGVDVEILGDPGPGTVFAKQQIVKGAFVNERYSIVHVQEFEQPRPSKHNGDH